MSTGNRPAFLHHTKGNRFWLSPVFYTVTSVNNYFCMVSLIFGKHSYISTFKISNASVCSIHISFHWYLVLVSAINIICTRCIVYITNTQISCLSVEVSSLFKVFSHLVTVCEPAYECRTCWLGTSENCGGWHYKTCIEHECMKERFGFSFLLHIWKWFRVWITHSDYLDINGKLPVIKSPATNPSPS